MWKQFRNCLPRRWNVAFMDMAAKHSHIKPGNISGYFQAMFSFDTKYECPGEHHWFDILRPNVTQYHIKFHNAKHWANFELSHLSTASTFAKMTARYQNVTLYKHYMKLSLSTLLFSIFCKLGQFSMPRACEKCLGVINSCVSYSRQTPEIYQVLPYSMDFKTPGELWHPLSKT